MHDKRDIFVYRHPFVKAVADKLRVHFGIQAGDRILLAVSGGADSVALLHVIVALANRPHLKWDVHVVHVQHHLREDAEEDASFVESVAKDAHVAFHRRDIRPGDQSGNVESNARRLRYEAIREVAESIHADFVATAHHADDQLETLLMRMMRGASITGMTGIASERKIGGSRLIRPLLWVDHAAAIAFLNDIDQSWCEDHTNQDATRWRARLRRDVLPVLRSMRESSAVNAQHTAERLGEAESIVQSRVRAFADKYVTGDSVEGFSLERSVGRRVKRPLLAAVIRQLSVRIGGHADSMGSRVMGDIIKTIRDDQGNRREFRIGRRVVIVVDRECVSIRVSTDSIT